MANPPYGDSSKDPICPTFAAGTWSLINSNSVPDRLNDSAKPGSANGVTNQYPSFTVNSFNNDWNNDYLTQSKAVTYSSAGLLSFGNTGVQS